MLRLDDLESDSGSDGNGKSGGDGDDDFDILVDSSFKIPKSTKKGHLLEPTSFDSVVWQREIQPMLIAQSLQKDQRIIEFSNLYVVNNFELEKKFSEKRLEMKANLTSQNLPPVQDSFAFFPFKTFDEVVEICRKGISVGNLDCSPLAKSSSGVTLLRYCDVLQSTSLSPGEVGYLVIFKIYTGRSKSVAPVHEPGGNIATPDPTFDCYTSSEFALYTSMLNDPNLLLFNNSQVLLFEYDEDYEPVNRPRHVLPHAVLEYRVVNCPIKASFITTASSASLKKIKPPKRKSAIIDNQNNDNNTPPSSSNSEESVQTVVNSKTSKNMKKEQTIRKMPVHMMIPLGKK